MFLYIFAGCQAKGASADFYKEKFFYGKGAYIIKFEYKDGEGEPISTERFWVEYEGVKYGFPGKRCIEPDSRIP